MDWYEIDQLAALTRALSSQSDSRLDESSTDSWCSIGGHWKPMTLHNLGGARYTTEEPARQDNPRATRAGDSWLVDVPKKRQGAVTWQVGPALVK